MVIETLLRNQQHHVPGLEPGLELFKAIRLMVEGNFVESPLVDENRVVGIVRKRSLLDRLLNHSPENIPIALCADHDYVWVAPHSRINDLAPMLLQTRQQIFPVLDDGRYLGALTRETILLGVLQEREQMIRQYEIYVYGSVAGG